MIFFSRLRRPSSLYFVCTLLSLCSMLYEYALAKVITDLADNFVQWESITIGTYLLGIGLGLGFYGHLKKASQGDRDFLIQVEWALMALALVAIPLVWGGHCYYRGSIADYLPVNRWGLRSLHMVLGCYQVVPLGIGLFSGIELAAVLRLAEACRPPLSFARIWCGYYVGALLATLLFAGILAGALSLLSIMLIAALINGLVALALSSENGRRFPSLFPGLPLFAGWLGLAYFQGPLLQLHLHNSYYHHMQLLYQGGQFIPLNFWAGLGHYPPIFHQVSHYQTIDLVPNLSSPTAGKFPQHREEDGFRLYLDQHLQFDSRNEAAYHEVLAHIPGLLLRSQPQQIAVLGGGDGLLVRELLKYGDAVASITLVELDPALLALADREPVLSLNNYALRHPKVEVVVGDALQWLRTRARKFDAIFLDFPYPYDLNGLRLYSREFFSLARRALVEKKGFIAMDVPLDLHAGDFSQHNALVLQTIQQAGFSSVLGFASMGESFVLAAVEARAYELSYVPLPFSLQYLSPGFFSQQISFHPVASDQGREVVNSLFKTVMLPIADLRF